MECEFCDNYFCVTCLKMTDDEYDHHAKSTAMWFCTVCKPKVEETSGACPGIAWGGGQNILTISGLCVCGTPTPLGGGGHPPPEKF